MGFEKFTGHGRGYRPTCSIRANGQVGFNRGSIHRYNLHEGYAVLYYDRDQQLVGIQLGVDRNEEGAMRLVVKPNNAFLSAKSFLDYYGIEYRAGTRVYEAEWDEEQLFVIVDLKNPVSIRKQTA